MAGYIYKGSTAAIEAERQAIARTNARIRELKSAEANLEKLRQHRTALEAEAERLEKLLGMEPPPDTPKRPEWKPKYGGREGLKAAADEVADWERRHPTKKKEAA